MAGLPHMLMLYERVRERETENRQINTQTEGGRGRKNTGERMTSKAMDTADVQNKVSYGKRPHGTI